AHIGGLAVQHRHQRRQVLTHASDGSLPLHAPHVLHDELVRQPDAEREASAAGRLHREGLAGEHLGMARWDGDDGRAELDALVSTATTARAVNASTLNTWLSQN